VSVRPVTISPHIAHEAFLPQENSQTHFDGPAQCGTTEIKPVL